MSAPRLESLEKRTGHSGSLPSLDPQNRIFKDEALAPLQLMFGANVLFPMTYTPSQLLSSSVEEYIWIWLPDGLVRDIVRTNNHFSAALDATPETPKDLPPGEDEPI